MKELFRKVCGSDMSLPSWVPKPVKRNLLLRCIGWKSIKRIPPSTAEGS